MHDLREPPPSPAEQRLMVLSAIIVIGALSFGIGLVYLAKYLIAHLVWVP